MLICEFQGVVCVDGLVLEKGTFGTWRALELEFWVASA